MTTDIVTQVNRIELSTSGPGVVQATQSTPTENSGPVKEAIANQAARPHAVQAQAKPHTPPPAPEQPSESKAVLNAAKRADVHLVFRVDSKTKEVSVVVVDKANKKILRTIPADEIKKMNAGDLVELLA